MILPYIELDADIEDIDKCDLEDVFDPNKHSHVKNGILSLDTIRQHPIEFWMPLFLSVNYGSNITMVRDGVRKVNIHKTNSKSKTNIFRGMEQGISELEQKKELALTFLSMLNSEVYSNDAYWLDIGRCLYNVCNGSIWGLEEWIRFGDSNGLKHTKYECKTQYYRFRRDSNFLSIKTLAWYARKDAPDLYSKWHSEWCLPIMEEEATTLTDYSVAKAFYRIYWLDYICVYEGRTRMWKVYNNHRWMDDEGGVSIRLELSEGFRKKFLALRTSISDRVLNEHNINNQKYLNEYIDQISRLIRLLEKDRFKSSVMRNLSDLFYDRAFAKAKDCNPYLLGCPNCIIEYIPNKFAIARDGKPEDYITKSTDCHYEKDFSWDHPTVQECHYWMKQVYPDPDLLHYVYKIFSTIPVGKNMEKKIYAHCGEGSNSKSMIKKAFQLALGEYNCDLPIEVLTKEAKDSGSASPEKAQLNAARVAWLDEPEDDEQLRTTWAKKISGGDSFFGRNLGSNGGSIKSSAKIFISCNNIPTWKNGDKAMRDRFIYIPYLAKWVFNAPDSIEEQFKRRLFKRDNNFEDCLIYLAPALLWICVYYYEKYCIEGLKTPPKIVREYTDKYWKENDPYHLYTTSRIETVYLPDQDKIRDRDAKISIPQLYGDFKNWYRFSFGGKEPTLNSFKYQLSQRWGPPGPYGWEGIKFIDSIANI
jgi:phage/plasmid-associated DNA primase